MKKVEFLAELSVLLSSLPQAERDKSLAYWSEIIDDRMEDGMAEEDAVAGLGEVRQIAEQIIMNTPMSVLVRSKVKRRKPNVLIIVLLVLGFPLWFPLLITAGVVLLSIYIAVWSVNVGLWSVVAGLGAGTVGGIIAIIFTLFSAGVGERLVYLGGTLVCAGIGILIFFASLAVSKLLIKLTVMFWHALKMTMLGKKES